MKPLRILIATDAWLPQVHGVVRTLTTTIAMLQAQGHVVEVIQPGRFRNFPSPFYPEIRLSLVRMNPVARRVNDFQPDAIHIATEGPIGQAVRTLCRRRKWSFTTSYHTKFPEYLNEMARIPLSVGYRYMRWFHLRSAGMMVATLSLEEELRRHRFAVPINCWSRGVDLALFHPRPKEQGWERPVLLYAGRVSKEKNIEAFLNADVPGTKVVVGDGPIRAKLEAEYPKVKFLGYRRGSALAETYANADVFVFPSHTDTFGLVIIEALACGVPVAAFPVIGPKDIVTEPGTGALNENLGTAIRDALTTGFAEACVRHAHTFTWEKSTGQFLANLRDRRTGLPFPRTCG